jgi:transposase
MNKEALIAENQALKADNDRLKAQVNMLVRALFGKKNEKHISQEMPPEQLTLDFGELAPVEMPADANLEEETTQITYERKKKKHPGRHKLPDHLTIEEIVVEPTEDTTDAKHIKDVVVDTLEYVPASLHIKRYILRRYKKKVVTENGEEKSVFLQASMPTSRPLPKSIAGSGLLTHLITNKFLYHLPFHRQIKQFAEIYGVKLAKSTINDWFIAICTLFKPLYESLKIKVYKAYYIQADESPMGVQDPDKKGKTHQGYQWLYYAPVEGLVLFDYQKGRGKNGPKAILEHFCGTLQTDGYGVYEKLCKNNANIELISCAAHARRYFYKALDSDPRAKKGLDYFQQLYNIERYIKENIEVEEDIVAYRQEKAAPILEELFEWAEKLYPTTLPKSPLGKAFYYLLKRKDGLRGYLKHAYLQIDNNLVENSVRPLALGRKNYLFAGSHDAAQRIAMMYSFFGSCQKQGINPVKWFQYVLEHINQHPINKIEELLPGKWVNDLD